ncbi:MAG: efflux RND transporter permease subunit [Eubacteriales bacterium]
MSNIPKICISRPVATTMLILMIVVVGISSLIKINMDLLPDIEYPAALVMTRYDNASPSEVEKLVTVPIEEALATVPGMDEMGSMSMFGYSIVFQKFSVDSDANFNTLAMREKISLIEKVLPEKAEKPMVMKLDLKALPIMQVYVSADMSLEELNTLVENGIDGYFKRAGGVASIDIMGGEKSEIGVKIAQERLKGYGITLQQISQLLMSENLNLPGGNITHGNTEMIVRAMGEFKKIDDIKNIPVNLMDGSVIRLGDIATVEKVKKEKKSASYVNANTAIGIMITKQSDANTVQTSNNVKKQIKNLEAKYPNLKFEIGYNQADFIENSIKSVANSALIGGLLAIIVVFLFLQNIRSTLVIAMSIPVSLLATFAMMKYRGMTLNLITLCSLTIAVGMLVDNAIVVLENIFRLRQEENSAQIAAENGSKEIFFAVLSSTLTTVVVFLPIALSGGLTGLMFSDFCFTIIIALMTSLVVAMTATPMFCSLLLKKGISTKYIRIGTKHYRYKYLPKFTEGLENLKEFYGRFMKDALQKPKHVVLTCILIFSFSIVLVAFVGGELLPKADQGSITVSASFPYGTSLEYKENVMLDVSKRIKDYKEIISQTINIGNSGFIGQETVEIKIKLSDKRDRKISSEAFAKKIKNQLSDIAGAEFTVSSDDTMSTMMGNSSDLELNILGRDLNKLEEISKEIEAYVEKVSNVESVKSNLEAGNPEILVKLKRDSAAYYGITTLGLSDALSKSITGSSPTNLKIDGEEIAVNISLTDEYAYSIENMKQILITGAKGETVSIGEIADFEFENSSQSINRFNQEECITLNVDFQGDDLGKSAKKILAYMEKFNYPDGYRYRLDGAQEEMQNSFRSLALALVVAIALVYLILAAQFESITLPFIVMMSIPFAMSGAFFAMFVTNTKLSMVSFLGLIMLAGIVVNNAILLVEFIKQNESNMDRTKALIEAGKLRLRPILMSSGTTVIGMIPLALGLGNGGESLAPLGVSIIGGLTASTLVTLVLIPVLYEIFDDGKQKRIQKQKMHDEIVQNLEMKWEAEGNI